MSNYDDLPEIDLSPATNADTAHQAKGGRKAVRRMMRMLAEANRARPLWLRQLRSHKAAQTAKSEGRRRKANG